MNGATAETAAARRFSLPRPPRRFARKMLLRVTGQSKDTTGIRSIAPSSPKHPCG